MKPVESSRARCDNGCFSNENVTRLYPRADQPSKRRPSPSPPPAVNGVKVVNDDINVLALIKGKERYIFLYDDSQRAEALRMLGRHASNPELSFSWYDAAVLSQKIRQEERQRRSRLRTPQVTDGEELL
jgi:hypothetical protein